MLQEGKFQLQRNFLNASKQALEVTKDLFFLLLLFYFFLLLNKKKLLAIIK